MARRKAHRHDTLALRRLAARRRAESLLRDPSGWPNEQAPLRVRARVMSSLAAQRQDGQLDGPQWVTMYRPGGRRRQDRLQFSLRPPLAAAAVVAMIVSAAIHFMGGVQAWQPWTDSLVGRMYDVPTQRSLSGPATAMDRPSATTGIGQTEAQALFDDVLRFRAHLSGRVPMVQPPAPDAQPPAEPSRDVRSPMDRPGRRPQPSDPAPASP
ncbi:MAG: hypothetical protein KatS3mg103_0274 [Phycisphaerales bacterium]|nr:MAG: hypothetical protein KatS3mg103_0274 [Phycisphaerales bacterium]